MAIAPRGLVWALGALKVWRFGVAQFRGFQGRVRGRGLLRTGLGAARSLWAFSEDCMPIVEARGTPCGLKGGILMLAGEEAEVGRLGRRLAGS